MTELSDTQATILAAAANRPGGCILPLPSTIKGAAIKRVVDALMVRDLIEEDTQLPGEPEWGRDGAGNPLTLRLAPTGLAAINLTPEDVAFAIGLPDMPAAPESEEGAPPAPEAADDAVQADHDAADETPLAATPEAAAPAEADVISDAGNTDETTETPGPALADPVDGAAQIPDAAAATDADATASVPDVAPTDPADGAVQLPDAAAATDADATAGTADPAVKPPRPGSKLASVVALLQRPQGASMAEIIEATGWQPHTARATLSTLGKKRGIPVTSAKDTARGRIYRTQA